MHSNMSSEYLHGMFECFSSTFKNTFTVLKKGVRVKGIPEIKKKNAFIYNK